MKELKPVGINEQIAVHLGFKKYKYGKDYNDTPIYQWHYPKGWSRPCVPCLAIPNFMELIKIANEVSPLLIKAGAQIFKP